MDDLPYVRSERTIEEPLDAALLVAAPQERQNLEDLIAKELKSPIGDMEIIPVQEDSSYRRAIGLSSSGCITPPEIAAPEVI